MSRQIAVILKSERDNAQAGVNHCTQMWLLLQTLPTRIGVGQDRTPGMVFRMRGDSAMVIAPFKRRFLVVRGCFDTMSDSRVSKDPTRRSLIA